MTRPAIPFFKYHGSTIYFAYADDTDLSYNNEDFKVSAFESQRRAMTFESQLWGRIRGFQRGGNMVTSKGFFLEGSISNKKAVVLSGFFGVVNYVAIGKDGDTITWDGLDTTQPNYLWACLVEEDQVENFRSSRRTGDWDAIATTTPTAPPGRDSILLATYESGIGINESPAGSFVMPTVASHANTCANPHGTSMVQTTLSGETLLSTDTYETALGVPQHHTASILANSGIAFDGVDFSELVKFIDGSNISQRTHLHALTSGLQYVGAAPSMLLVTEQLYGDALVQYDHQSGYNVGVLSGADAITRTCFDLLVPEGFREPESFTFVHGQDGGAASVTVHMKDTAGSLLTLAVGVCSGFPTISTVPVPAGAFAEGEPFEVQLTLSGNPADVVRFGPWAMRYHTKNS